jgi:hypothetical protein
LCFYGCQEGLKCDVIGADHNGELSGVTRDEERGKDHRLHPWTPVGASRGGAPGHNPSAAPNERHALALMALADGVNLPVDRLMELLAILEAQPTVTRELFLRRFVEAWLIHQREAYNADHHGGGDG